MLALMTTAGLVGCNKDVSDRDLQSIDTVAVKRLMDTSRGNTLRIVDARPPDQFEQGHLPGAMNMTLNDLPERARLPASVSSARTVVVYGQHPSSALARGLAKRMVLAGHKGVRVFEGGFDAWKQAGHPVERIDAPADGDDRTDARSSATAGRR